MCNFCCSWCILLLCITDTVTRILTPYWKSVVYPVIVHWLCTERLGCNKVNNSSYRPILSAYQTTSNFVSELLLNVFQWVMAIVWRLRGNIIRTALCWIVWHNVHSSQHTYVSSSHRSNRLGFSHWDPYAVHRGGCLELYYCNPTHSLTHVFGSTYYITPGYYWKELWLAFG